VFGIRSFGVLTARDDHVVSETLLAGIAGGAIGLVGALLGAAVTARIAKKQRDSDKHLAKKQRDADVVALEKELQHDRELQDLQHARAMLSPIAGRVFSPNTLSDLAKAIRELPEVPSVADDGARVNQCTAALLEALMTLTDDHAALMTLVGPKHPTVVCLKDFRTRGRAVATTAGEWLDGTLTREALGAQTPTLVDECEKAGARFMVAVQAVVQWRQ
jgi:hypothetical protein